jgi:hypothetical protein
VGFHHDTAGLTPVIAGAFACVKKQIRKRLQCVSDFQDLVAKINLLLKIRICGFHIAIPPHPEGRYGQSSRNVRRGAMDAGGGARRAKPPADEQKRVVPASRR